MILWTLISGIVLVMGSIGSIYGSIYLSRKNYEIKTRGLWIACFILGIIGILKIIVALIY